MVTIAVDAMGGDNAPVSILEGCLSAMSEVQDLHIILAGPQSALQKLIENRNYDRARISFLDAQEVITAQESPTQAVRQKKQSSLVVAMDAVKSGAADAVVSAGPTGAVLTAAIVRIGRIKGVLRPALSPLMPTYKGGSVLLIDCGANVDCKPEYIAQFGLMGSAYMRAVVGIENPKVSLLNIGTEAGKGNDLTQKAYVLMQKAPYNFVGNMEARDALTGDSDVIACDGFDGNILLKSIEGTAGLLFRMIRDAITTGTRNKIGALLIKDGLKALKEKMDYEKTGGAPLLGVNGVVIKAHGNATAAAFEAAIEQAANAVRGGLVGLIRDTLGDMKGQEE